ncbi:MAG: V-type ATP synthase subunit F [Anaerolineae bacterium]|nr:V-type ATP synthase subunit F [Anaerolineae bacterium]
MRVLVVGSAPAVWGFALTGVQGEVVETAEALHAALDRALAASDVGIVLVTQDVAVLARERIDTLTARSEIPLIVEIPGPEGPLSGQPSITDMLRRSIGVKV